MKNQDNVTHSKYYIYRHKGDGEPAQLRSSGDWVYNFDLAVLCFDYESVMTRAENYGKMHPDWFICVGKVHVMTDPYFTLKVVHTPK